MIWYFWSNNWRYPNSYKAFVVAKNKEDAFQEFRRAVGPLEDEDESSAWNGCIETTYDEAVRTIDKTEDEVVAQVVALGLSECYKSKDEAAQALKQAVEVVSFFDWRIKR